MLPPRPNLKREAAAKRVDGAFAMLKGAPGAAPPEQEHEPAEDGLIQELEQWLAAGHQILEKLKATEAAETHDGVEETHGAPPPGMP